jgi:hypothetical protein
MVPAHNFQTNLGKITKNRMIKIGWLHLFHLYDLIKRARMQKSACLHY